MTSSSSVRAQQRLRIRAFRHTSLDGIVDHRQQLGRPGQEAEPTGSVGAWRILATFGKPLEEHVDKETVVVGVCETASVWVSLLACLGFACVFVVCGLPLWKRRARPDLAVSRALLHAVHAAFGCPVLPRGCDVVQAILWEGPCLRGR